MFCNRNYFAYYFQSIHIKFVQQTYTITLHVLSYLVVVRFTKLQQICIKKKVTRVRRNYDHNNNYATLSSSVRKMYLSSGLQCPVESYIEGSIYSFSNEIVS